MLKNRRGPIVSAFIAVTALLFTVCGPVVTNAVSVSNLLVSVTETATLDLSSPGVDLSEHINAVKDLNSGTVAVTFKTTQSSSAAALVSVSDTNVESRNLTLAVKNGHLYWEVRDNNGYISKADAEDAAVVNDGGAHTAAVVVTDDNTSVYLDGQKMFTTTGLGFFSSLSRINSFRLGANYDNGGKEWPFVGTISKFEVYGQALNKTDIQSISSIPEPVGVYQEGKASLEADVQGIVHSKKYTLDMEVHKSQGNGDPFVSLQRDTSSVQEIYITQESVYFGQGGSRITVNGNWNENLPSHITATVEGDSIRLYADGTYIGKGSLSSHSLNSVNALLTKGSKARIYAGILNTAQIQSITRYEKPDEHALYDIGYKGAASYRIPSLLLTQNGTLIAAADQRVASAYDSPNDINLVIRKSSDGGKTWNDLQTLIDLPGSGPSAASVIDSVLVQDRRNGRITILVDMFPGGVGQPNNGQGVGVTSDGSLILTSGAGNKYHLRPDNTVVNADGSASNYSVGKNGDVFLSGVQQNNYYDAATPDKRKQNGLYMERTAFLVELHSDDDGTTWSKPRHINHMIKEPWMKFVGTGPGTGIQIQGGEHDGRLVVPIYYSNSTGRVYSSAVVYSDDGGQNWHRSSSPNDGRVFNGQQINSQTSGDSKSSLHEATVVQTGQNELTLYMRNLNPGQKLGVARSHDGGETWSTPEFDASVPEIFSQPNSMSSGTNFSTVIFANASARLPYRGQGVLRMSQDHGRTWTHSRTFNDGHYVYQAMVWLPNGNIGLLWEREWQGLYFSEVPAHWLSGYGAKEIK